MNLTDLEPKLVWHYFGEISKIPRASKHEERIVDFLEKFANDHSFKYKRDAVGNIIISKPATPGFEHLPKTILQSHVDMVCEKIASSDHNFDTDPIKTIIDGDFIHADGTTLGADDGIGVAIELALLASDNIGHCAIDCIFTVDEETGITGAHAIDKSFFDATRLINLDSEEENIIYIGCAGGCTTQADFAISDCPTPQGMLGIRVCLRGLRGGHSGCDIHLGRGNAAKIIARFAHKALKECNLEIANILAGNLHNAIPREATLTGAVPFAQRENIRVLFNIFSADIQDELRGIDPDIRLTLETIDQPERVFTNDFSMKLISALVACPHGVLGMSRDIEGLVETSNNLASVKRIDNKIVVTTSQRSSVESCKEYAQLMVTSVFELAGANIIVSEGYPAWQPNPDSPLVKQAAATYRRLFGADPIVTALHAGVECGLFAGKCPELDMISIGPNVFGVHTPDERVEIASVARFWRYVTDLISHKAD